MSVEGRGRTSVDVYCVAKHPTDKKMREERRVPVLVVLPSKAACKKRNLKNNAVPVKVAVSETLRIRSGRGYCFTSFSDISDPFHHCTQIF